MILAATDVEKRVLVTLRDADRPLTTVEIAERLHSEGIPGEAVSRAVLSLLERHQIRRTRARSLQAA